ncbi:MAG TPA: YhdP family protein [Solimonas sp.]|nr:YhdP family protein [Solimonas sp.]
MERVRRRFWTWSVSAIAMLVIAGAVVSGLFQLAVLALPSYRDDLSAWVTRVADRPVQIGGVNLVWRGVSPRLDLSDITLFDERDEPALSAQRLSLGFSLPHLLIGDAFPTRVELSGLSVDVDVDAEGNVTVAGFDAQQQLQRREGGTWARELRRFGSVRLESCEVRLTHASLGSEPLRFTLLHADLDRSAQGFDLDGLLQLPGNYGDTVAFDAEIAGDVGLPASWSGTFNASAQDLKPQPWLARWLAPGTATAANGLEAQFEGTLAKGRIARLEARVESDELAIARAGRAQVAKSLQLKARLTPEGTGWRLDWPELLLDDEPQLSLSLRWRPLAEPGGFELDADADDVHLGRLAPWLAYLRDAPAWLAAGARSSGELRGVVLRLRQATGQALQYSLRAGLQDVALAPDDTLGFTGLSADLSATENGGRLQLAGRALTVAVPKVIKQPIPFDRLAGAAEWRRGTDGWRVAMPDFEWQLAGGEGKGRLGLLLPVDTARSQELDLAASFSAPDATRFKAFMPNHWGEPLQAWLNRAIVRGRVPHGELVIRGPLADFPYVEHRTGDWQLDLDAAGVRLAYAPEWPAADNVTAHLRFRGKGLAIEAQSGQIGGNEVKQASARFDDFSQALLVIDGLVEGQMPGLYRFVRQSPLRRVLAGLVDNTAAAGPATVGVHLEIPLHDAERTRVAGSVALDGVELQYAGLKEPVSDIRGSLFFTEHGVRAEHLDARFEDLVLDARIDPREGTTGVVAADFHFTPRADGEGASSFVPALVRQHLSGTSAWHAELPLSGQRVALLLSSELVGTAVALPAPLGKTAAEPAPIRVSIGSDAAAPVRVRVDYRERLDGDIALAKTGEELRVRAVSLHLGPGAAEPMEGEGFVLTGAVPELDVAAWAGATRGADLPGLAVRRAELQAQHVLLAGQLFGPTHIVYAPTPGGAHANLSGQGLEGTLDWSEGEDKRLVARLSHAAVDFQHGEKGEAKAGAKPDAKPEAGPAAAPGGDSTASDPARLPVLDIGVEHLMVSGVDFGKLRLATARVPGGQRIETLALSGGKVNLSASGQWRRAEERSTAELKFTLASSDVASVLHALDYAPSIDARQSRFTADLKWPSSFAGLEWEQAQGRVDLAVENGMLKAVDPGAGRVLGLINFYALPRRLTLDFRDVTSTGLAFDQIDGGFNLGSGVAITDDLKIKGPSVRMEVRGRIGLAARDYDQRVTVYPDISAGVTLGAALLAGPAVGALVLLAQEVLDKPLDQVTQLSYRLTGSWDNPKVEKVEGPRAAAVPAPG